MLKIFVMQKNYCYLNSFYCCVFLLLLSRIWSEANINIFEISAVLKLVNFH